MVDLKINVEGLKRLPELDSASTVEEVFYIIYYQLLEDVVEELCNEDEKQLLYEYKNDILKLYLQRSIFEVPLDSISTCAPKSSAYYPCLKLLERIDLSANEVVIIKHDLAKLLQLPSLELAHFDDGSIHLILPFPKKFTIIVPTPLHYATTLCRMRAVHHISLLLILY